MTSTYAHELARRVWTRRSEAAVAHILKALAPPPADEAELGSGLESRPAMQAELASAVAYLPSDWLLDAELPEIAKRRKSLGRPAPASEGEPRARALASDLTGLCVSGGGIRSATF